MFFIDQLIHAPISNHAEAPAGVTCWGFNRSQMPERKISA
jgi:hypothetical protein